MMCMERACLSSAVSPLLVGPGGGPCLPAERGSPEELVRQWLAGLPSANSRQSSRAMPSRRPGGRDHGGKDQGEADGWGQSQHAPMEVCPGDGTASDARSRADSESTDYGNIWVPAHMFSQHARVMGLGAITSKPTSATENTSSSPTCTAPTGDNPSRRPSASALSTALPRVRSTQRQLYQNWSVLPPVKPQQGQPTPPKRPQPTIEESAKGGEPLRGPPTREGAAEVPKFQRLPHPAASVPRVRSPVARATLLSPGLIPSHTQVVGDSVLDPWDDLDQEGPLCGWAVSGREELGSGGSGCAADITGQEGIEHICAYSRVTGVTSHWDLACLHTALHRLNLSGFYFGRMSWEAARSKLRRSPVGTFLVRDSSDPRYLFSLSVKTSRGTTSIRLVYAKGGFRLDCCDPALEGGMPRFDCVITLIRHYIELSMNPNRNTWVFYESTGRKDTPVMLGKPYRQMALSLKDTARRALHKTSTGRDGQTTLPARARALHPELVDYINQYPHPI